MTSSFVVGSIGRRFEQTRRRPRPCSSCRSGSRDFREGRVDRERRRRRGRWGSRRVNVGAGGGEAGRRERAEAVHRQAVEARLVNHLEVVTREVRNRRVLLLREHQRLADRHRAVEAQGEQRVQALGVRHRGGVSETEAGVAHPDRRHRPAPHVTAPSRAGQRRGDHLVGDGQGRNGNPSSSPSRASTAVWHHARRCRSS